MNEFQKMLVIFRYQFRNYIRGKRILIMFLITFLMALTLGLVMIFSVDTSALSSLEFAKMWLAPISFLTVLAAIFFAGDAISGEFHTGTAYYLLPNPVRRESIFFGKYLASFLAALIGIGLYWCVSFGAILYLYSTIKIEILESLGLNVLYLASIIALTYFFSSLFKNSTVSIVMTFIIYLFVFSIVDSIAVFSGFEPWYSITYASQVITLVLTPNYQHIVKISRGKMVFYSFQPYIWEGIVIMVAYLIISTVISLLLFVRKEVT